MKKNRSVNYYSKSVFLPFKTNQRKRLVFTFHNKKNSSTTLNEREGKCNKKVWRKKKKMGEMQSAARTGNNNSRNFISDDQRTGGEREKEIKWWRWKKWNGQHLCLLCRRGIPSIKGGKENVHHPHVEILVRHTYTHALTQSSSSLQFILWRRKEKKHHLHLHGHRLVFAQVTW